MKIFRKRCRTSKGYEHYWERRGGACGKVGKDLSWDRELLLVCARCGTKKYIDSVIREISHSMLLDIVRAHPPREP